MADLYSISSLLLDPFYTPPFFFYLFTLPLDPTGCDEAAELDSTHVEDYDGRKASLYDPMRGLRRHGTIMCWPGRSSP